MDGIQTIQDDGSKVNTVDQIGEESTIIHSIADKVIAKLPSTRLSNAIEDMDEDKVNYVGKTKNSSRSGRSRSYQAHFNRETERYIQELSTSWGRQAMNTGNLRYRSCQSTGHLYHFDSQIFCQACGTTGLDAWTDVAPITNDYMALSKTKPQNQLQQT